MSECIKVCCRFRPLNKLEKSKGSSNCMVIHDNTRVELKGVAKNYIFDRSFGDKSTQSEVFKYAAQPAVKQVMSGYNATIFAYGQTGSGKTYSMMGEMKNDDQKGIIPRLVDSIFNAIGEADSTMEFTMKLSYVEIYNEKIRDLMSVGGGHLRLREKNKEVYIEGVTETYVMDSDGVMEILMEGGQNRAQSSTLMNQESSRSHSVFVVTLNQKNKVTESTKSSKLHLVDLAGSEKVGKTGAAGQTLEEAKHINKSLSALGNVINGLASGEGHIPYRNSQLTRLLQDSLGGNSKTCLIITASPSEWNLDETLSTLKFGNRAKNIKNNAKINSEMSVLEYKGLLRDAYNKIKRRDKQIYSLQHDIKILTEELEKNGIPIPELGAVIEMPKEEKKKGSKSPRPESMLSPGVGGGGEGSGALIERLKQKEMEIANLKEEIQVQQEDASESKTNWGLERKEWEAKLKKADKYCSEVNKLKESLEGKTNTLKLYEKKMNALEKEHMLTMSNEKDAQVTLKQKLDVAELLLKQEKKNKRKIQKDLEKAMTTLSRNNLKPAKSNVDDDDSDSSDDSDEDQLVTDSGSSSRQESKYDAVLKALQKKCDQYLDLQRIHKSTREQLDIMEKALDKAQNEKKIISDKRDQKVKVLGEKLEAAENLCKRLLESGLYWRQQRRTKPQSNSRMVMPMHGGGRQKMRGGGGKNQRSHSNIIHQRI